jgi:hypothetical protein
LKYTPTIEIRIERLNENHIEVDKSTSTTVKKYKNQAEEKKMF